MDRDKALKARRELEAGYGNKGREACEAVLRGARKKIKGK